MTRPARSVERHARAPIIPGWLGEDLLMDSALVVDRLQFAFTITFHYLFPQLTMGLALLIVVLSNGSASGKRRYTKAARFWARSSASTSRSASSPASRWNSSSGPTGRSFRDTPAASSVRRWPWKACSPSSSSRRFSACSSSARSGLGRARTGPPPWPSGWARGCPGTSSSPPTRGCSTRSATRSAPNGAAQLTSFWALFLNPWAIWQYLHTMCGAVDDGRRSSMAAVGAFYVLSRRASGVREALPQGRGAGRLRGRVAADLSRPAIGRDTRWPSTSRPRWPRWKRCSQAETARPLVHHRPARTWRTSGSTTRFVVPGMLSFLTYGAGTPQVRGLDAFPRDRGPTTSRCSTTRTTSWSASARC